MSTFTRPRGQLRFQELSLSKQPLPSAELDSEFNAMLNFLNTYYPTVTGGTTAVVKIFINAVLGDVTQVLPADGEVLAFREDATGFHVYLTALVPGDTVMGLASIELVMKGECVRLLKVGTDWRRIN